MKQSEMETPKLQDEISSFSKEAKKLRKILRDTQRCFNDINIAAELHTADLSPDEEKDITYLTKKPPCFVVFGSRNAAKATVTNAVLGSNLLPVQWGDNTATVEQPWRTVRFKHGNKRTVSMILPGSYELLDIESLMLENGKSWDSIPLDDLEKNKRRGKKGVGGGGEGGGGKADEAHEEALLEVCLSNPVLNEGGMVVVAESCHAKETMTDIYDKCTADVVPIVLYALLEDGLSAQEIEDLTSLKESHPNTLICFIQVKSKNIANCLPSLHSHKRKHAKMHHLSRNTHNPLEGIRETLEKNHITPDYVQRLQRGDKSNNVQLNNPHLRENMRTRGSIRSLLPCTRHGQTSCNMCSLNEDNNSEEELPHKVFKSDDSEGSEMAVDSNSERVLLDNGNVLLSNAGVAVDSNSERVLLDNGNVLLSNGGVDVVMEEDCDNAFDGGGGDYESMQGQNQHNTSNAINGGKVNGSISPGSSTTTNSNSSQQNRFSIFKQLLELGFLSLLPNSSATSSNPSTSSNRLSTSHYSDIATYSYDNMDSELIENFNAKDMGTVVQFTRQVLKTRLVHAATLLNVIHNRCLQMFILTAFDMARDMQLTPKKLDFAKKKETELYACLLEISMKKQDEIRKMIADTITEMKDELFAKAEGYDFIGVDIAENGEIDSSKDLKICTGQIQELVLGHLNSTIATRLLSSIDVLKDSYTGVLARCLESLEKSDTQTGESVRTSLALREILNSAYQVDITMRAGASFVRILLEKMKQLMHAMAWKNTTRIDSVWKRKVAADMLATLSEYRLARSICVQIKERLKQSHESFAVALRQLENRHSGRLERTEEQRLKLRKVHAPRIARLALESVSMRDYIMHGMPDLGREVGRGQYGVVYSCPKWSGNGPYAIKSVVPPDDKHWNDLALEFHYTKNVPDHPRLVALKGSVIDYTYGGGSSPAVLLVMDRLQKDLYAAIKSGLDWLRRLQVAIDVVEGIRYLHSQGLVHRDIKLKNVLLDDNNRGKLTDLGFCKPEAMMSGSIVGTPIHMAPELFSGKYDGSVDVYAFGVLFWYVCAGHVKLPYAFEQCTNKEMLWTSVKRGVRPEKLSYFDPECWTLMEGCWNGDPSKRPLLGVVEPQLCAILERFKRSPRYNKSPDKRSKSKLKGGADL